MNDYRLRITVRNARLLRAIEAAGLRPGLSFAAAAGISYGGALLPYLNLTRSPLGPDGLLRDCAWALCDYLGASPDELWSDEQLLPLSVNAVQRDFSHEQVLSLRASPPEGHLDPQALAAQSEAGRLLLESLDSLSSQESQVIRERFGIGTQQMTLRELADRHGMTGESVRQIEMKALRKLRRPSSGAAELADAFDITVPARTAAGVSRTGGDHA